MYNNKKINLRGLLLENLLKTWYNESGSQLNKSVKGVGSMATTISEKEIKKVKSKFTDEFEIYLKNQCTKTTFNGTELESFTWYKKVLGLM